MSRQSYHPLVLILIGLAGLGLFYRMFNDPLGFISQILFVVAIVVVIIFIYKRFLAKKFEGQQMHQPAKPRAAKRFDRLKNNIIPHKRKSTSFKKSAITKRRAAHNFTVIEGKKNKPKKKKDRAFF